MNSLQLKIIATIFMIIDHIGLFIFPDISILRMLGRIAFPIYAFLLINTFNYTKNRKAKTKKLYIYGLITQLVFLICGIGTNWNVFISMEIAFFIMVMDNDNINKSILFTIIFGVISVIMGKIGTLYEILIILGIYEYRKKEKKLISFILLVTPFIFYNNILFAIFTIIGLSVCKLYNGKYKAEKYKNWFWWFYPAHILILYLISGMLK